MLFDMMIKVLVNTFGVNPGTNLVAPSILFCFVFYFFIFHLRDALQVLVVSFYESLPGWACY